MRASTQRNISRAGTVFTWVDAGMTAGFGYLAASTFIMKPILAAGLGALSFTLAFLPVVALACYARRWTMLAGIIMLIYAGGFLGNFFSNYGLSAAVMKGNIIEAQNLNLIHEDARTKVARLRAKDAQLAAAIGTPGAWMSAEDAQKALDRTIAARDREADRITCGPKCEALDARARELRLEVAKAKAREAAIADRERVQAELIEAEKAAADTPKHISVAANQAEYLARIFSLDLKPDGDTIDWTLIGTSIAISLFISIFAHLCNFVTALNLANIPDHPDHHDGPEHRKWIASNPEHPPAPLPLRSEPVVSPPSGRGGSSVSINMTGSTDDEAWRRSMEALDLALARVKAKAGAA